MDEKKEELDKKSSESETETPTTTHNYLPSLNTGIFGTYTCNSYQTNPTSNNTSNSDYRPSLNTGIFGTYIYQNRSKNLKKTKIIQKIEKKFNVQLLQYFENCYKKPDNNHIFTKKKIINNAKNCKIYICKGSVVNFSGDALVNAANAGCLGGGGVDGAITSAGGNKLAKYRSKLPLLERGIRCYTGDAKITKSGKGSKDCELLSDYVIHAVGPIYGGGWGSKKNSFEKSDYLLYQAYGNTLLRGKENKLKTIGFCLISSGIFRGSRSLEDVLRIGVKAVSEWIYDDCEAYIIGFTDREVSTLLKVAPQVLGEPNIRWVKPSRKNSDSDSDDSDNGGKSKKKGFYKNIFGKFGF